MDEALVPKFNFKSVNKSKKVALWGKSGLQSDLVQVSLIFDSFLKN